jgi:hypothetical protein
MFFDPSQLTLGQVSSTLRDLTLVGFLLALAWKSRGIYEHGVRFFERWTTHMNFMEESMKALLTNHLFHIEKDLKSLAARKEESKSQME